MSDYSVGKIDNHMQWMDFVASLVGSLAWPVAAVLITLLFRRQVTGLFENIKRLTWGDKTVDFADKLDKVEDVSREITTEPRLLEPNQSSFDARFDRLLAIAPAAAILDAWVPVEATMRRLGLERNYDNEILKAPLKLMQRLRSDGAVSKPIYEMLRQLRSIRNSAAHQREVSPTDALRFRELSDQVNGALGSA